MSAAMYPTASVMLYGIVPVPAVAAVGAFVLWDLYQATRTRDAVSTGRTTLVDHAVRRFGGRCWFD